MDTPYRPHLGDPLALSRPPATYVAVQPPGAVVELADKDVCRAVCADGSQKQVGLLLLVHACKESQGAPCDWDSQGDRRWHV